MSFAPRSTTSGLTRRECIKLTASLGAIAISPEPLKALGIFPPTPQPVSIPYDTPAEWTGHNGKLDQYFRPEGYPAYDAHPRYLGELHGSWYQIGRQYGERAGDLIRMVYEGWYRELLPIQDSTEIILNYLVQQREYYELLVPEALEMMHGIADGAAPNSQFRPFPANWADFYKILMINSYYGLKGKPPTSATAELAPPEIAFTAVAEP